MAFSDPIRAYLRERLLQVGMRETPSPRKFLLPLGDNFEGYFSPALQSSRNDAILTVIVGVFCHPVWKLAKEVSKKHKWIQGSPIVCIQMKCLRLDDSSGLYWYFEEKGGEVDLSPVDDCIECYLRDWLPWQRELADFDRLLDCVVNTRYGLYMFARPLMLHMAGRNAEALEAVRTIPSECPWLTGIDEFEAGLIKHMAECNVDHMRQFR